MPLFEKYLLEVSNLAISAGHIIMKQYKKSTKVIIKEDQSPLTNADLDSNRIICSGLSKIDSTIPIVSEESFVKWHKRKEWNKYWLIDPLDGTKEFINKNGEFTVNIALIENNRPVLGIIYVPALSILYYAYKDFGSYKISCTDVLKTLYDSKKIYVNKNANINLYSLTDANMTDVQIYIKWNSFRCSGWWNDRVKSIGEMMFPRHKRNNRWLEKSYGRGDYPCRCERP